VSDSYLTSILKDATAQRTCDVSVEFYSSLIQLDVFINEINTLTFSSFSIIKPTYLDLTFLCFVQTKKLVRKLFVNTCRVRPDQSLQLITAACTALPQPLSVGTFGVLSSVYHIHFPPLLHVTMENNYENILSIKRREHFFLEFFYN